MEKKTKKNTMRIIVEDEEEEEVQSSSSSNCFFCAVKEPDTGLRRAALARFFHDMPCRDDPEHVLVMSSVWSVAMARPADPDLPSAGALRCMSRLISRALADPSWLRRHQNVYIPYYAAHALGSYTIRSGALAALAARSGALPPLLDLLRGRLTWVEQRVAARALGHLASYDATFPAVARHAAELLPLAMRAAATCLDAARTARKKYQRDLLTRGLGGAEMEGRKAEEWASQLQCWSLHLLSCFAARDEAYHPIICRDAPFLRELCGMWGGLVHADSPAGAGLMRILCRSAAGRKAIAQCPDVVESLCNLSRSSDRWQYMGIDCLLMLIEDSNTRVEAMPVAGPCLADLVELRSLGSRKKLGDAIAKALLLDFDIRRGSHGAEEEVKSLTERRRREAAMTEEEAAKRQAEAARNKKEGNELFSVGDVEGAALKYTEALQLCPLRSRKERAVLHSNRAQCRLLLREPDGAASDATRALCLASPANGLAKCLWRRSQAYEMKGMAKESLIDCVMFVNTWINNERESGSRRRAQVPYYAARMIHKQISAAGLSGGRCGKDQG